MWSSPFSFLWSSNTFYIMFFPLSSCETHEYFFTRTWQAQRCCKMMEFDERKGDPNRWVIIFSNFILQTFWNLQRQHCSLMITNAAEREVDRHKCVDTGFVTAKFPWAIYCSFFISKQTIEYFYWYWLTCSNLNNFQVLATRFIWILHKFGGHTDQNVCVNCGVEHKKFGRSFFLRKWPTEILMVTACQIGAFFVCCLVAQEKHKRRRWALLFPNDRFLFGV